MRKSHILFIFSILTFISCGKSSNDNTDEFKENDAVFIRLVKEFTLNNDGSMELNYTHRLKYQSYNSFNRYFGETFVVYNPQFQELKINKCETTQADGNLIKNPDNAFNEVLPAFADKAPAYNHLREMVITHTGLELGAIVDLNYQLKTKTEYWPELMGNEELQSTMPYKNLTIIVKIPDIKDLKYEILNSEVQPKITKSGNQKIYEWNFENIQGLSFDRQSASSSIPRLLFSTFNSNTTDASKYLAQFSPNQKNLPEDLKLKAASLTKDSKTTLEKALSIQHFLVHEFNYWPIPPVYTGYKGRTIDKIWNSGGGNALEKTVLFNAMLGSVGIPGSSVAVLPDYYPNEMINLLCFNEFAIRINSGEDSFYLSVIHDDKNDALVSMQNKQIFELSDNAGNLAVIKPLENIIAYKAELQINGSKEIMGNCELRLSNYFNPYFKLQENTLVAKNIMPKVPEAKIEEINKNMVVISGQLKNAKFDKTQGNYFFLTLPVYLDGINSWNLSVLPSERTTVLELPGQVNESYSYTYNLPANLKLVSQTTDLKEENTIGKVGIKISNENGIVKFERKIQLLKNKIEPADYEQFRKLLVLWNINKYKELVFKE